MVKITYIVPCYNAARYLGRCISSIYEQGMAMDEFEVIAVNDGSTDDTLHILESYKYTNMRILSQQNKGLSCARNAGLSEAKGEYIWFVDADDFLEHNAARELYSYAESKQLDILIFALREINNDEERVITHKEVENHVVMPGHTFVVSGYQPNSVCAALYRTSFLLARHDLRFYPRLYHQDVEFNYRAVACAERVSFIEDAPYVYELHPNSISQSKDGYKVKKRLIDNGIIAASFISFASTLHNKQLSDRIRLQACSILIGTLMQLRSQRKEVRSAVLCELRKMNLFPLSGPYKSVRQYLGAIWLNIRYSLCG